jgi:acetyl esterase/lipase
MTRKMKTEKSFTLIIFLFGLLFVNNNAQEKIIKIWPDKIPGAIANASYKVERDSNESWSWMKKVSDPTLDYYPVKKEKSNGTAVIVCPGGAYSVLAIGHEGSQIAHWLNSIGVSAFVLKYRLPSDEIMTDKTIGPLQDGQEAVRIVRRHAKGWNIDPNKIGIIGFSAGGHFASSVSTHFNEKVYESMDSISARPDFSILIYPVISMDSSITHMGSRENLLGKNPSSELVKRFSSEQQVTKNTPPAFLVHSLDDEAVPVLNSINYLTALKKNSVPGELHIYQKGGHGYGLGRDKSTESSWPESCAKWLLANGFIK